MKTKKLLIITTLIIIWLFSGLYTISHAQTWFTADRVTMEWVPVTTYSNGDPIPESETVYYNAYLKSGTGTNQEKANENPFTDTRYTFKFTTQGKYLMGASAVRMIESEQQAESPIAWSNDPSVCQNGETFGIAFYYAFSNPLGLRKE